MLSGLEDQILLNVISTAGTALATGVTLSKLFFSRISELEKAWVSFSDKVNRKLNDLDKNLAINMTIIEQLKEQLWESKKHKN